MTLRRLTGTALLTLTIGLPALAQRGAPAAQPGRGGRGGSIGYEPELTDPPPIVTHHSIQLNGKQLNYTATVGKIAVPDLAGDTEGHMFYVAYTVDPPDATHPRPVTFSYNGGPGSASVLVHMGGLGPRRVLLNDDGSIPAPPFSLVDNQETWLDATDLVFVDAIGTGYSRATSAETLARAASVSGDLQSFSEFIRLYLTENDRLNSPVLLAGESYGTFRSAGLAGTLLQHDIAVSGIILMSSVLNLGTISPSMGQDRPYWLALPTLTAIAYYHKKLPADLQKLPIEDVVEQSKAWAGSSYEHYLDLGDALIGAERQKALTEMSRLTGLSVHFLDDWNLRVGTAQFQTELLRDEKETLGRYDGGQIGTDRTPGQLTADYDPSGLISIPYVNEFVTYLRDELGYKTDLAYSSGGGAGNSGGGAGIPAWNYELPGGFGGFADSSALLSSAFARNPAMKLMLVEGYFDQATPMFEADYSMNHLFITPQAKANITIQHYEAGHMIYIRKAPREKLRRDAIAFIATCPGVARK